MKRALLIIVLFISCIPAFSQFYEDFSSSDLATNNWQGDLLNYKISTSTAIPAELRPGLQLDDDSANVSYLVAPFAHSFTDSVEWTFWVKLSFMATTNNFARVYIVSDQADISGNINGYFVGIGETDKKITLVKQTGAATTVLITGTVADLSASTNVVRVRVVRQTTGDWKLYTDVTGGTNWVLEGTANDNSYSSSSWHGLFSQYTVSNATKIYFDELYAGSVQVDTIKPYVSNVDVISQFQLDVTFSEFVDSNDAVAISNYLVSNSVGNPIDILIDGTNPLLFHLSFASPFPENIVCTLSVTNVRDLVNNTMLQQDIEFAYYLPQANDILIHEIMADPSPVVGLPEYEYVELYNATNLPINLNNWKLAFGSTVKTFSNVTILSGDYLILCGSTGVAELTSYGVVYDLGTISVTNDGQQLVLYDQFNHVIHQVKFTTDWYQNSSKDDGGWSLEMIDPLNPCAEMSNWKASVHPSGGTPGAQNSVYSSNPDNTPPQLVRVSVISNQQIQAWFTEPMDSLKLLQNSAYAFSHGLTLNGNPQLIGPDYKSVILNLTQTMQETVVYTLTISDTLFDCVGNVVPLTSSARFALSEPLESGDIIINEVLSNPLEGLSDFVEIYNVSNKIIELKEMNIANIDVTSGEIASPQTITADGYLIFPGDHIVLSTNVEGIRSNYICLFPNNFILMGSMPSYNNDEGNVVLVHVDGTIIDRLDYDVSMHFPLLATTDGVSLERINYLRPTADVTNWHSASETSGFATPGYINSQYSDVFFEGEVLLTPEIFSPDNDGYNDVVDISYTFAEAGYVGTITVFDSRGRLVKNLVSNQLLGTSGTYSWDGVTNDNQKAAIGMYIIFFEVFDIQGNKRAFKQVTVLGGYLNK